MEADSGSGTQQLPKNTAKVNFLNEEVVNRDPTAKRYIANYDENDIGAIGKCSKEMNVKNVGKNR